MPIYLDYSATTPLAPEVRDALLHHFDVEFGNAGSRTHEYGARAKKAVQDARRSVAALAGADSSEVIFTSGATEANNIAILGLADFGRRTGRRKLVTTAIEHKAVLEPMEALAAEGFELTVVGVDGSGRVSPGAVLDAVRDDTLLVSVMHANNETGVLQPISEVANALANHPAYFHVDAVQGFGKELAGPRHPRIDLLSMSAHKLFGPKGVGALIARRRGHERPPLKPLMFGGGQERGLRPGTLAVPLIAALGVAAEIAVRDQAGRRATCLAVKEQALAAFEPLEPTIIGDLANTLPHVLTVAFPGVDSEALMLALKDVIAISNGSACTSASYQPSHVLTSMGLEAAVVEGAVRISWSHVSPPVPWSEVAARIADLRAYA
jgi:cysteine desulfurase